MRSSWRQTPEWLRPTWGTTRRSPTVYFGTDTPVRIGIGRGWLRRPRAIGCSYWTGMSSRAWRLCPPFRSLSRIVG